MLGEPGSIPGGVTPGFSHVEIVSDDAAGERVFSGISRFPSPFNPAPLHTFLASPSSALHIVVPREITSVLHIVHYIHRCEIVDTNLRRIESTSLISYRPNSAEKGGRPPAGGRALDESLEHRILTTRVRNRLPLSYARITQCLGAEDPEVRKWCRHDLSSASPRNSKRNTAHLPGLGTNIYTRKRGSGRGVWKVPECARLNSLPIVATGQRSAAPGAPCASLQYSPALERVQTATKSCVAPGEGAVVTRSPRESAGSVLVDRRADQYSDVTSILDLSYLHWFAESALCCCEIIPQISTVILSTLYISLFLSLPTGSAGPSLQRPQPPARQTSYPFSIPPPQPLRHSNLYNHHGVPLHPHYPFAATHPHPFHRSLLLAPQLTIRFPEGSLPDFRMWDWCLRSMQHDQNTARQFRAIPVIAVAYLARVTVSTYHYRASRPRTVGEWNVGTKFSSIREQYVSCLINHYGANSAVVFDGYEDDNSIKHTVQKRRGISKTPVYVNFDENMLASVLQENFLANEKNNTKGIEASTTIGDTDGSIVRCGLNKVTSHSSVVVIGEDVDLLVLLTAPTPPDRNV
ncbi:hypothetical protein PR048_025436 [Dryococelus australis]|uniref:Uncharacterized protein n=1 Tax=Dryococelus australis TaxID=614101 RepID=A0ABQ9GR87_9NEOP|nr:hypothetical protein PR048_025436 [Dryococelus australis]